MSTPSFVMRKGRAYLCAAVDDVLLPNYNEDSSTTPAAKLQRGLVHNSDVGATLAIHGVKVGSDEVVAPPRATASHLEEAWSAAHLNASRQRQPRDTGVGQLWRHWGHLCNLGLTEAVDANGAGDKGCADAAPLEPRAVCRIIQPVFLLLTHSELGRRLIGPLALLPNQDGLIGRQVTGGSIE